MYLQHFYGVNLRFHDLSEKDGWITIILIEKEVITDNR